MTPGNEVREPDWSAIKLVALRAARRFSRPHETEDLAAAAMEKLFRRYVKHGEPENWRAYTRTVVRNSAVDVYRKRYREVTTGEFEELVADANASGGCATPEEAVLRDEQHAWETRRLERGLAMVGADAFACPLHAARGQLCPEQQLIKKTAGVVIRGLLADAPGGHARVVRELDFRLAAVAAGAPEEVKNLASAAGRAAARAGWIACGPFFAEHVLFTGSAGQSLRSRYPAGLARVVLEAGKRVAAAQRSAKTWSAHDDEVMGEWLESRGLAWDNRAVG